MAFDPAAAGRTRQAGRAKRIQRRRRGGAPAERLAVIECRKDPLRFATP
jgi:hypothetical protein